MMQKADEVLAHTYNHIYGLSITALRLVPCSDLTKRSCISFSCGRSCVFKVHWVLLFLFRFFTVYGPWGRPDMAYFSFTRNIVEGQVVYNILVVMKFAIVYEDLNLLLCFIFSRSRFSKVHMEKSLQGILLTSTTL